ncbi:MAG: ribosome assembly factor SBDS [Nitrososphaerota archaeon]|jgi:ribosome maturation protein SDO1|nr:ribosome assembly factor SBDS [Nitrososphaerota archaeon]
MSTKFTSVRLTIEGEKYEILVYPDPALNFKMGKQVDPAQVLAIDEVYSDSSRGLRASAEKLKKHFKTEDHAKAALEVLKRGELQLTQEQRMRLTEEKRRQVVTIIAKNYVDPKTHLPHPPVRVEQAMQEARVSIDPFKDVNEQAKTVIESIRSIIPLKSERVKLAVKAPAQYAGQAIGVLKGFGEILKEEWGQDGGLSVVLEVPAASQPSLLDRLGAVTKGSAQVTLVK